MVAAITAFVVPSIEDYDGYLAAQRLLAKARDDLKEARQELADTRTRAEDLRAKAIERIDVVAARHEEERIEELADICQALSLTVARREHGVRQAKAEAEEWIRGLAAPALADARQRVYDAARDLVEAEDAYAALARQVPGVQARSVIADGGSGFGALKQGPEALKVLRRFVAVFQK